MKCPDCGTLESRVKKTLIHMEQMGGPAGFDFGELKMRERKCLSCGNRFMTFEVHEEVFRRIAEAKTKAKTKPVVEQAAPTRRSLYTRIDLRPSVDDE